MNKKKLLTKKKLKFWSIDQIRLNFFGKDEMSNNNPKLTNFEFYNTLYISSNTLIAKGIINRNKFINEDRKSETDEISILKTLDLIGNISISYENIKDIIPHLTDMNSINELCRIMDKKLISKNDEDIIDEINLKIFANKSYINNFWFKIKIDDNLKDDEIKIHESYKITSLFNEDGKIIKLKIINALDEKMKIAKIFGNKYFSDFLRKNLKLDFCFKSELQERETSNNSITQLFYKTLKGFLEKNNFILFNLDNINEFSNINDLDNKNHNFHYVFRFDNLNTYNQYYELLDYKLKLNFCKIFHEVNFDKQESHDNDKNKSFYKYLKSNLDKIDNSGIINKINYQNFIYLDIKILDDLFDDRFVNQDIPLNKSRDEGNINNGKNSFCYYNGDIKVIMDYNSSNKRRRFILNDKETNCQIRFRSLELDDNFLFQQCKEQHELTKDFLENLMNQIENKTITKKDVQEYATNYLMPFFKNILKTPICFLIRPYKYNFNSFLMEMKLTLNERLGKQVDEIYLDFNMFQLNTYNDLDSTKIYLNCFFDYYKSYYSEEINKNKRVIFILDQLKSIKCNDEGEENIDSDGKFKKHKEYILTELINKKIKVFLEMNKLHKNKYYFIFTSENTTNNIATVFPSLLINKQNNYTVKTIDFIDKSTSEKILLMLINLFSFFSRDRKEVCSSEYNDRIDTSDFILDCASNPIFIDCIEFFKNFVFEDIKGLIKILFSYFREFNKENTSSFHSAKSISSFKELSINDLLIKLREIAQEFNIINSFSNERLVKLKYDFSEIGGLYTVKDEIRDTFLLSIKCSEIFNNNNPIKLSTGILLIGPPGCGKTLIAASIQKEFKMNFFSVKGPELLNKYIGASEAAVREIFENAKKCIPCVIFLDEFDSIAPKRGSGSSGVTDRIVNQLLTYLDGIESREGIFIVAASSRPDLIDSAVLRPGRLDKILNCDFPDKQERIDILRKYYDKSFKIDPDDNYEPEFIENNQQEVYKTIEDIADKTEYYTGADLQSLIYNSFLLAAKNNIFNNIDRHPIINKDDLIKAFNNFKRSLSDKDIKTFKDIKKNFLGRTEGNIKNDSNFQSNKTFESIQNRHDEVLDDFQDKNLKITLI